MDSVLRAAAILAGSLMSVACSNSMEYRPLGEGEVVRFEVFGNNEPFTVSGIEYHGWGDGFIENQVTGELGIRATDVEEYLPDTFVLNDGQEDHKLRCVRVEDDHPNDFSTVLCNIYLKQTEPGRAFRIRFNEFDESVIVMPELSNPTSPKENGEFSVSSGDGLVLSWEPLGKDDSMGWEIEHIPADEPGSCMDKTSEHLWEGSMDDTGSFVIPKNELPADLPADGCPVLLRLSRARRGNIDPGIKQGAMFGIQNHTIRITLKP